jgi:ABC-type uncharacterized transport system substrate-binding protein
LAVDLIGRKVDVIVTSGGTLSALAAKRATSVIPIVFNVGGDPVEFGLVVSLARPGGNLTGVSIMTTELMPKRFELLSELVPQAGVFALLVNPNNPNAEPMIRDVQKAARARGVQLNILNASSESEIDAAFTSLVQQHAGALVVGADAFFGSQLDQLVALAARHAVPAGTSLMTTELMPKRLELLSELVPQAGVIALFVDPNNPNPEPTIRDLQEAARAKGLQLHLLRASTESEIDAAFPTLVQLHAAALVSGFYGRREQFVALAALHAVPAMYYWREFAEAGGLISYGSSLTAAIRQAGAYVGRILADANPADLPVEQPTTFELVINLKTAKELGLTIPQSLLARADEVIE